MRAVLALAVASAINPAAPAHAQTFKVLYSFGGGPGGQYPEGNLLPDGGKLYGIANYGGACSVPGCGTVFQLEIAAGRESVFHSFTGQPSDGANPAAGLTRDSAGNLYGTTENGGTYNQGTVFEITAAGAEAVLYNFQGGAKGGHPLAGLVRDSAGNLYGTTSNNGVDGTGSKYGTVFRLGPSGNLTTLHEFSQALVGVSTANLLLTNGKLYGAALGGHDRSGFVFGVDANTGQERLLYSFTGAADGCSPLAGLISDGAGNLYGATSEGGSAFCGLGYGVVFKLDLATHQQTVLHTFNGSDGAYPAASLIRDSAGNLYGTTSGSNAVDVGYGTVFKLDTRGNLTTLYAFTGGSDGAIPLGGVVLDAAGNLFGTASTRGAGGEGTLFEITP